MKNLHNSFSFTWKLLQTLRLDFYKMVICKSQENSCHVSISITFACVWFLDFLLSGTFSWSVQQQLFTGLSENDGCVIGFSYIYICFAFTLYNRLYSLINIWPSLASWYVWIRIQLFQSCTKERRIQCTSIIKMADAPPPPPENAISDTNAPSTTQVCFFYIQFYNLQ